VTAIIDEHGVVKARLPAFTEDALDGTVGGRSGATPYVRLGNYPVVLLCLALLAACAFRHTRRRRQ